MQPFVKVTLWGPAPYGGTLTADIDHPMIRRNLDRGWTIGRVWKVTGHRRSETLYVGHPAFARRAA